MPFSPTFLPAPPASRRRRPLLSPRCTSAPPSAASPSTPPPHLLQKRRRKPSQYNSLILRHAKAGDLAEMQKAVQNAVSDGFVLNAINYTIIADAHATHGNPARVFDVFSRMRGEGVVPTNVTMRIAIKACESWDLAHSSIEAIMTMLEWVSHVGLDCEIRTWNLALRTLVRKGAFTQAFIVFSWMRKGHMRRPLVPAATNCSYNLCLLALGKQGQLEQAVHLFGQLLVSGEPPDVITYNTLLELAISAKRMPPPWGCKTLQDGKPYCNPTPFAQVVLRSMKRQRLQPDVTTETLILRLLTRTGAVTPDPRLIWERMRAVCRKHRVKAFSVDKKYFDALIVAFASAVDMNGVAQAYSEMIAQCIQPDAHTIRALRLAAKICGDVPLSLKILDVTLSCGLQPDAQSYTSAIAACARSSPNDPETADKLLQQALQRGIKWTSSMVNAAISSCDNDISMAIVLWQRLRSCPDEESRNVLAERPIYEALLRICGRSARPDLALRIFYAAKKAHHVAPNSVDSRSIYNAFKRGLRESDGEERVAKNAIKRQYVHHLKTECGVTDWADIPIERIRINF